MVRGGEIDTFRSSWRSLINTFSQSVSGYDPGSNPLMVIGPQTPQNLSSRADPFPSISHSQNSLRV